MTTVRALLFFQLLQLKPVLKGVSDSFPDNPADVERWIKDHAEIRFHLYASAALSSAPVFRNGAGFRRAVFDQSRIRRVHGNASVFKNKSGNAYIADGLQMIKNRVGIPQAHKGT